MAKKPIEMTDAEALKQLFPKIVREELKRVAHEKDRKPKKPQQKTRYAVHIDSMPEFLPCVK